MISTLLSVKVFAANDIILVISGWSSFVLGSKVHLLSSDKLLVSKLILSIHLVISVYCSPL